MLYEVEIIMGDVQAFDIDTKFDTKWGQSKEMSTK